MSNYEKYTPAQRKAWGKKMAAARAAKAASYGGKGAYYKRSSSTISGRGAYKYKRNRGVRGTSRGLGGLAGSAIGTALGGPLGGAAGGAIGSGLGHMVGEAIKYFTGTGDYEVVNNCFLKDDPAMAPIVNKNPGGGDVFRRCEYIGDVVSSSSANTFNLHSYSVNPGLESTFQWLSQVAANYEEYEFQGLYFEFRTMSADALNSTNTALGQVIMAMNYNAASPVFQNKQAMENYEGGVSGKPSSSIRYFVECAKLRTVLSELYVRQGLVPTGQDQRLYDLGNFQIATNGLQGTSVNLGELWVSYQVSLRKPKLFSALGLYGSYALATNTSFTNALPLGDGTVANVYDPSNTLIGFVLQSGSYITWNSPSLPQTYFFYISWRASGSVALVTPSVSAVVNQGCTVRSSTKIPADGTTSTNASRYGWITYQPSLQVDGGLVTGLQVATSGTLPTTPVQVTVLLIQVPNTIYGV